MKYKHLTQDQRYTINVLLQRGESKTAIATVVGVHKSTISRELKRNSDGRSNQYKNELAHRKYKRRMNQRPHSTIFTEEMKSKVRYLITRKQYSPEQIVGRCSLEGMPMVSHETIYRWIYDCKRHGDMEMANNLRRRCRKYSKRANRTKSRGIIPNRRDISERPEVVDRKVRFGDLEIDTIVGKNHKGAIMTINDRCTCLVWLRKLQSKEAAPLAKKASNALEPYKNVLHTITSDNGKEFALHQDIADNLDIDFFFAKPYHSWERGANENCNGLIRQYIPKGVSFEDISARYVRMVQDRLNNRPRKKLGFLTPIEYSKIKFNFTL